METGYGYETVNSSFVVPMQNGYIVSWPIGFDGNLSDMVDMYHITATEAKTLTTGRNGTIATEVNNMMVLRNGMSVIRSVKK